MNAKTITILSIDGGGVRGIIPAVVLQYLESKLQEYDGKNARLADYFDVISGSSTGGLIAAMISTPKDDDKKRPKFDAKEIVDLYTNECQNIFPKRDLYFSLLPRSGPIYNGVYLHQLINDKLGENRLSDTLTKVVIPAYEAKTLTPIVFSTYQVNSGNEVLDAKLADICISTTAAPLYLPAYQFYNKDVEFNMIDGSVAANNPTLVAITEAVNARSKVVEHEEEHNSIPLILSLGTGVKCKSGYTPEKINNWWTLNWINNPSWNLWNGDHPIINILGDASSDMVDHYCTMFYQSRNQPHNFLRIQDSALPNDLAPFDNGDPDNMKNLKFFAEELLKKPVTRSNLPAFEREIVDQNETYEQALDTFAVKLIDIKNSRAK
ncbi:patatin-like protein 2 [Humulus lupulus]|uniref:patatin-like protein 2 n=1 Tax=Humulus lupulus TaxID=3486 RepID=UPI002B40EC5B|nr:patatin-like protein 2 [Humulus lupulus]